MVAGGRDEVGMRETVGRQRIRAGQEASAVVERIFNYPTPFPIPYEFLLIAGKKMAGSAGRGAVAWLVTISRATQTRNIRIGSARADVTMPAESRVKRRALRRCRPMGNILRGPEAAR